VKKTPQNGDYLVHLGEIKPPHKESYYNSVKYNSH